MAPIIVGTKSNKTIYNFYEPMLILLLIFGYNFDFYNYNVLLKNVARFYCVSLVAVVAFATSSCCMAQELSQIWSLLEYSSSVIIILFFKSKMRIFMKEIDDVDVYLRIKKKHYFWDKYKFFIITLNIWIVRFVYTYLFCLYSICYENLVLYIVSLLSPFALDLNRVWRCILFDTIRYRLKLLRIRLEENPDDNYYLYVKDNKALKEDKIKFCFFMYRCIADLVELVSPELHASLFMSVLCNLPKLIYNVYHILTVIEGLEPLNSLSFVLMHLFQISILLFTPFLIVELYSVEVEKIRLLLIHKRIEEDDPIMIKQIELFLQYTTIKPFRYKIWRIIPINLTLPLALINICTTYVIVVINFTHLYG